MIKVDIWAIQPEVKNPLRIERYLVRSPSFLQTVEVDPQENCQLLRERLRLMIPQSHEKVDLLFISHSTKNIAGENGKMIMMQLTPPCCQLKSDLPHTVQHLIDSIPTELTGEYREYFELVPLERIRIVVQESGKN